MALTLKINSTSGSKWRPFSKIIITRKKNGFFGGYISTSVNYIKRPFHAKFDAFNQKCTIFSHNRLTIRDFSMSSMYLFHSSGLVLLWLIISISTEDIKMFAKATAIFVPIAVPCIWRYSQSSPCDHSRKRPALVTTTIAKARFNCHLSSVIKSSRQ